MAKIELYAFEYFDELRKKWMRARYRAQKPAIAASHAQYRIVGEPEIRDVPDDLAKRLPYGPSTFSSEQTDTDA